MRGLIIFLWILLGVLYVFILNRINQTSCANCVKSDVSVVHAQDTLAEQLNTSDTLVAKNNQDFQHEEDTLQSASDTEASSDTFVDSASKEKEENTTNEDQVPSNKKTSIDQKAIINFPQNSKSRISSPALEAYLDDVAAHVIEENKEILLIGHADNVGNPKSNYRLALARAKTIKQLLVERSIPANKIRCESRGDKEPIADNSTRAGRDKNKRVELFIK